MLDGVVNSAFDVVERGCGNFDFASRKIVTVVEDLGTLSLGLTASRDGRTIFFARVDSSVNELMLVENFR